MNSPFYKYKDMFGLPNTGVHRYRFLGVAIIDVLLTVLIAIIFAYFTKISLWLSLGGFFIIGIAAHRLFYVRTTVDKLLFP
jgi:hypothetical protein